MLLTLLKKPDVVIIECLTFPKIFSKYITTELCNRQNCIGVLPMKRSALFFQVYNLFYVIFDWCCELIA